MATTLTRGKCRFPVYDGLPDRRSTRIHRKDHGRAQNVGGERWCEARVENLYRHWLSRKTFARHIESRRRTIGRIGDRRDGTTLFFCPIFVVFSFVEVRSGLERKFLKNKRPKDNRTGMAIVCLARLRRWRRRPGSRCARLRYRTVTDARAAVANAYPRAGGRRSSVAIPACADCV